MSVYAAGSTRPQSFAGRNYTLWDETPAVGSKSKQASLPRDEHLPNVFSIEVKFASTPGNFTITVQTADTDAEEYYIDKTTITQATMNASFVARAEISNVVANFVRLVMTSRVNSVACVAKIF